MLPEFLRIRFSTSGLATNLYVLYRLIKDFKVFLALTKAAYFCMPSLVSIVFKVCFLLTDAVISLPHLPFLLLAV